jgi:hypothetical protein
VNNQYLRAAIFFGGIAAKISLCLFFYALGLYWAISTAFPYHLSFMISAVGLPLIAYSVFTGGKMPRKFWLNMFLSSVLVTAFFPVPPYFPVIHNVFFIFPLTVFLFLTIFIAIQQRTIDAIFASFLAGSLIPLLMLSCMVISDHRAYSERWTIGFVLLFSAIALIWYMFIRKLPSCYQHGLSDPG